MSSEQSPEENPLFGSTRDVLAQVLGVEPDTIRPESSIADDLDADSLDMIEVAQMLEEAHGIKVEQAGLRGIRTVNDVVNHLGELVAGTEVR